MHGALKGRNQTSGAHMVLAKGEQTYKCFKARAKRTRTNGEHIYDMITSTKQLVYLIQNIVSTYNLGLRFKIT